MASWQLDPVHSSIHFSARHLMVSHVRGWFRAFGLDVDFDPAHPELGHVVATVDAASIDTGSADRDDHLRSADFLDVDSFPTLAFVSTRVMPLGPDEFSLHGDLTIRGETRPVVFDVVYHGEVANPQGGRSAGFTAHGSVGRNDFGLAWNTALEAGGLAVSDEVKVEMDIELARAAAPAADVEAPAKVLAGTA
jgi:polyisoprenoid-binding protein YceI